MNYLYETTISKVVSKEETQKTQEGSETVSVTKTVKALQPVKVALLQPDRKLVKRAGLFYAQCLAEYLKAGLLPLPLVAKRYSNDGGPLTEQEKVELDKLKAIGEEYQKEFYSYTGQDGAEVQEKKATALIRLNDVNIKIASIQNAYADIFDNTAEMKSRDDAIEWWGLHLMYVDEDGTGYKPIFQGNTYDEKIAALEKHDKTNDPFYNEVIKRLSYLISFWFTSHSELSKSDFATVENLFVERLSTYAPELEVTVKVEEEKPVNV